MMRRTPFDRFVRYRLVREPVRATSEIMMDLADELVPLPGASYLDRLRAQMKVPQSFRPNDLGDRPTQEFLRRWGIWSMFHLHAGTREAIAVFADVRARTALQTLIAGSAPDEVVLDVAANHLHVTLSLTGLREFRHYFWNTAPMTRRELAKFIRTFLDDEEMARIASLPPGPSTVARAMFVLGMPPAKIDPEESLRDMFATTGLMFDEYARELPPGPGRSIAMKHMVDAALDLREVLAEIAPEQNNLADEVVQFLAATTDRPNPSLAELREGTPPIPVASLLPAVDAGDDDAPTTPG